MVLPLATTGSHLGSVILAVEEKMSEATGKEIRPRAGREYYYFRIRRKEKTTTTTARSTSQPTTTN